MNTKVPEDIRSLATRHKQTLCYVDEAELHVLPSRVTVFKAIRWELGTPGCFVSAFCGVRRLQYTMGRVTMSPNPGGILVFKTALDCAKFVRNMVNKLETLYIIVGRAYNDGPMEEEDSNDPKKRGVYTRAFKPTGVVGCHEDIIVDHDIHLPPEYR